MRTKSFWMLGVIVALCTVVGIAAASQGQSSKGGEAKRAVDPPGTTYTFVDSDLTRDTMNLNYTLPKSHPAPTRSRCSPDCSRPTT